MTLEIFNIDNIAFSTPRKANLIFADYIYENLDFSWVNHYWDMLADGGVLIAMTDYHSVAEYKMYVQGLSRSNFVNWLIYKQEWGGTPKKGFPQKHDDILIFSKGEDFYWNKDAIQVPKATAGTKLDKKGTGLKTPCSVFGDLGNFSTLDKERVKDKTGKNVPWQKPLKLLRRLITPFVKEGDFIIDPFMGVGTCEVVAKELGCDCVGIEYNQEIFELAKNRLKGDL